MSTLKTNNIQHVDRSDPSIIINTDGSVSIAGTATYEDVTSIDSVGIITGREIINAQKQVHVGTGVSVKAGGINVTAGITTVQALQATTGTFSGAINGTLATAAQPNITSLGTLTSLDVNGGLGIAESLFHIGDTDTRVAFSADNQITFDTAGGERLRISSVGQVLLGTITEGHTNADDLTIATSGNTGITIRSGTSNGGNIFFSDATSGAGEYSGMISYDHSDNIMTFATNDGIERVRIASDGDVGIGVGANPSTRLHVKNTSACIIQGESTDNNTSTVLQLLGKNSSGTVRTVKMAYDNSDEFRIITGDAIPIKFFTQNSERLRIASNGNATFTGIVTATTFIPTEGQLANRNLIINGDMRVAQRATTFTGSYGSTTNNDYYKTVDRIFVAASNLPNTDVTSSQVALTSGDAYDDGFRYAFQLQMGYQGSVPTNVGVNLVYRMEAQDIVGSGWNYKSSSSYITLSFWAKSTVSRTFYGILRTIDGTNYKYPFSYALTANTWKKVEVTVPGNSNLTINNDTGEGLRINLAPYLGTDSTSNGVTLNTWSTHSNSAKTPDQTSTWFSTNGATFEVTGLQLEVGQTATPFEHKSYQQEFLRCCRYYYKLEGRFTAAGRGAGSSAYLASISTPVPLRAEPVLGKGTNSASESFSIRVYKYDGISDSTNTPTVGTRGWMAGNNHITIYQTGQSVVDDRVLNIYMGGGYLDFASEL